MNMQILAHLLQRMEILFNKIPPRLLIVCGVVFLSIVSVVWRVRGWGNYPFWVDEFSTANQARIIQQYGLGFFRYIGIYLEPNNILTHTFTAGLFSLFGESEKVARLPALISGSFVPLLVYLLAKRFMPVRIAWGAGLLTATAYIQILWSLQARGYAMQQMWYVLALLLVGSLQSRISTSKFSSLIVILVLAFLTHYSSLFFIFALIVSLVVHTQVLKRVRFAHICLLGAIMIPLILLSGLPKGVVVYLGSSMFGSNNIGYYHSFLWREYGMMTFMGIIGLTLLRKKSPLIVDIMFLHILGTLVFVSFFFGHHMSKYITGIFPYLYIGVAYFLFQIGRLLSEQRAPLLGLVLIGVMIVNGHKFATRPKTYYSINRDFREIANIDYDLVYEIVRKGIAQSSAPIPIIETWPGRPQWYLGQRYKPMYILRWQDEEGFANGHAKKTPFKVNTMGEKYLDHGFGFVSEENDLQMAMKRYPKGFIFIDDDTMPREVIDYAEKNLKKEIFLDHYPLDDNPYSIWPATLYSWGFDKVK